jgi:hypothetical protein
MTAASAISGESTIKVGKKEKVIADISTLQPVKVTWKTITLHVGQEIQLAGTEYNDEKGESKKIIKVHRGIRYESSDKEKVSVSYKEGTVTANEVTDEPIEIYVYAQNGVYSVVKINVVE